MKLLFKQRFFSWLDSYDIFDETGTTLYTVQGKLDWGHRLHILDRTGQHVGTVKERVLAFLPQFEMYENGNLVGTLKKQLTLLRPRFELDCSGWQIEGNFMEWDYTICDINGRTIATVSKELFRWTDTYSIDAADPRDALRALMIVLAIDAEKCSRN